MTLAQFIAAAIRMLDLPDDLALVIPSYERLMELLDEPPAVLGQDDFVLRRQFIDACRRLDETITVTMPLLYG